MPLMVETLDGGPVALIPIHFEVPQHHLPLETFVETAMRTADILKAFNREIFQNELSYQVVVLPPEPGTFKTRLAILGTAGAILWAAIESDTGRGFIKGLTGREPSYWTELAGSALRDKLKSSGKESDAEEVDGADAEHKAFIESVLVTEMAKAFLQKEEDELLKIGIDKKRFRDAYDARNNFYGGCYHNPDVSGVGFSDEDTFPIRRSDFAKLIVDLPPVDKDDIPWRVSIDILNVTSPVWNRHDRQRSWKGKDADGHDRYFKIEDENFWSLAQLGQLDPHVVDAMKVQWAYHDGEVRPKDARVLRVLEFNGRKLGDPLDENALNALIGIYRMTPSDIQQQILL